MCVIHYIAKLFCHKTHHKKFGRCLLMILLILYEIGKKIWLKKKKERVVVD